MPFFKVVTDIKAQNGVYNMIEMEEMMTILARQ
jgi:hypothetical protein